MRERKTEDIRSDSQAAQPQRHNVNMTPGKASYFKVVGSALDTRKSHPKRTDNIKQFRTDGERVAYLQISVLQKVFQEEAQIRLLCLQRLVLADCRNIQHV